MQPQTAWMQNRFSLNEGIDAMMYAKTVGLGLWIVALGMAGCDNKPTDTSKTEVKTGKSDEHAPHGEGPDGGVIFDLGKYHAEFTVHHPVKECTVLVIDGEGKDAKPMPVAAKEFTLTTKETKTKAGKVVPPMTIKLMPKDEKDGKAAKFVGTDPGIGNVADFEGTVVGEIDGKPSQGTFKE